MVFRPSLYCSRLTVAHFTLTRSARRVSAWIGSGIAEQTDGLPIRPTTGIDTRNGSGHVQLDIVQREFDVRATNVEQPAPIDVGAAAGPFVFGLALALDAERRVR